MISTFTGTFTDTDTFTDTRFCVLRAKCQTQSATHRHHFRRFVFQLIHHALRCFGANAARRFDRIPVSQRNSPAHTFRPERAENSQRRLGANALNTHQQAVPFFFL